MNLQERIFWIIVMGSLLISLFCGYQLYTIHEKLNNLSTYTAALLTGDLPATKDKNDKDIKILPTLVDIVLKLEQRVKTLETNKK